MNLQTLIATQSQPAYYHLYFGDIDGIGHEYGPNSPQLAAEIDAFLTALDRLFLSRLACGAGRGVFLLTADHGMVETNPPSTIYLNTDPAFAGIEHYLQTNRQGWVLPPGGSCRDVFLRIRKGLVDEAQAFLARRLAGRAVVSRTRDLIDAGFFGQLPPSPEFLGRAGDLIILPYAGEGVWWYEKDRFEQRFFGHHGGLTPEEMAIPLLACSF